MNAKTNTLINVSPYVDLPENLESYDGRGYRLVVQPLQGGSGFVASYDSIFHDDIYCQDENLHEAKRKLAIKINGLIQSKQIKRISQPDLIWGVFARDCYRLTKEGAIKLLLKTFEDYNEALMYARKSEKRAIHLTGERK